MAGALKNHSPDELDFAVGLVPDTARISSFSLAMAWWSCSTSAIYFVIPIPLAKAYGTMNVLIGLVLTIIVYALINYFFAKFSIKNGASVAVLSKEMFGSAGAALASLIFSLTATYYAVFETYVLVQVVKYLLPSVAISLIAVFVVASSVAFIFGSIQNWLDKLNGVLLPVFVIGLSVIVGAAIYQYGYSDSWLKLGPEYSQKPYGWVNCFVAYMGVWVLMMYTMDFARFGRKKDIVAHSLFNFGLPFFFVTFIVCGCFGLFLAGTVPMGGDFSELSVMLSMIKVGGAIGFIFIWATQTRINTANYHLATVNLEGFVEMVSGFNPGKIIWAMLIGVIVWILMLSDVFSYILTSLAYQGIFVVSWVAVALAHIIYAIRKDNLTASRSVNIYGLAAWGLGVIAGLGFMHFGGAYESFSAPATAVIAFVSYLVFLPRVYPTTSDPIAITTL